MYLDAIACGSGSPASDLGTGVGSVGVKEDGQKVIMDLELFKRIESAEGSLKALSGLKRRC